MPTYDILTSTATTVVAGTTIRQTDRIRSEKGIWQVEIPAAGSGTVKLYGRASGDSPWHLILSWATGNMVANETKAELVDLFPEMTVALTGNSGSHECKGWLVE